MQDPKTIQTLEGWKAVADYLGRSTKTVQNWAKTADLPIRRRGSGPKAPVYAVIAELDRWKSGTGSIGPQFRPSTADLDIQNFPTEKVVNMVEQGAEQSLAGATATASAGLMGDSLGFNNEKTINHTGPRLFLRLMLGGIALVGCIAFVVIMIGQRHSEPFKVALAGKALTMLDQTGKSMWQFDLPGTAHPLPPPDDYQLPKPIIADIDGDGQKELLIGFRNDDKPDDPDTLYCLDTHGRVRWTHQVGREIQTQASGRIYAKNYTFTWIGLLPNPTPQGGRILVGAHRGGHSIFVVEELTADGRVVGDYFHPGWLYAMKVFDLDGDGSDEVVLGGVNNAYGNLPGFDYPMTLVVLDPRHIEGEGPAPGSDDRHFRGMSSGMERAVLLFREFGKPSKASDYCTFREFWVAGSHFEAVAIRINNPMINANYQFNSHLQLQEITASADLNAYVDTIAARPLAQIERIGWYNKKYGDIKVLRNDFAIR